MMTIDQLNARFGAPGRIIFRVGHAGYPNVLVASRYGTAEVALLGGNVLSYRPTGQPEVLFRPARRDYNRGEAFHGGIPVCWPQFGNRFDRTLPQHGFARLLPFAVRGTEYSEEMTEITLGLRSDEETLKLWPHPFDLELKITVSMKLNLSLLTKNTGAEPFDFNAGFHPYFLVRERDEAVVRGIDGATIAPENPGRLRSGTFAGELSVTSDLNEVFAMPVSLKHEYAVIDNSLRRAVAMVSAGNTMAVVWNCGEKPPSDFRPDDWRRYVCVEPVTDWPGGRTLAAGAVHELTVAIQSTLQPAEEAR